MFCISTLLPSLLPYMIFSSIISKSSLVNKVLRSFFKSVYLILGICIKYVDVLFWGNLSGFVVGPKLLAEENDSIDENLPITKYILLSSNAGIGFVISFIGQAVYGNFLFGLSLYFSQILISLILNSFVFFKKDKIKIYNSEHKKLPFLLSVSNSISSTANAFITICANTVVFSTLSSLLVKIIGLPTNSVLSAFIYSLFDISQGVKAASLINNKAISLFIVGFSVGFGGISIFFQIFSICQSLKINKIKFILIKLLQGFICGILLSIYSFFFTFEDKKAVVLNTYIEFDNKNSVLLLIILTLLVFKIIKRKNINKLC